MPNRNRHRNSGQTMNVAPSRPIVAVQVNPVETWAQPTVVVNAEICPQTPPQQDTQRVQKLQDQVAQLKKSNKNFKREVKKQKKVLEEKQKDEDLAVACFRQTISEMEEHIKEEQNVVIDHQQTMYVESAITDYCLSKTNDTLLTFDALKHPSEMPQGDEVPEAMETHGHSLDQLDCIISEDAVMVGENPDGYRFKVQKTKGISQWEGIDENSPLVHEKMVVKPSFVLNVENYLSLGGQGRHWLATWKWCEWTHVCDNLELRYKGEFQELWDTYPKRMRRCPCLTSRDIQTIRMLINNAEDLLKKLNGQTDVKGGRCISVAVGENKKVDAIVKSTRENIKHLFRKKLMVNFRQYCCSRATQGVDGREKLAQKLKDNPKTSGMVLTESIEDDCWFLDG